MRRAHSEHNALLEDVVDGNTGSAEQQANIIVRELEQHELLMEDNPEAEELRRLVVVFFNVYVSKDVCICVSVCWQWQDRLSNL